MKRNRALFDAVVLVVYLVAANPALTGVPVHEFIGLGAFVVMGVHIVASGDGLAGRGRAGRLALNIVLLVALAACVVSGVMVSGAALPSLGLYATGYSFWDPLHAVAAKVLLAAGKRVGVVLGFNTADEVFYADEFRALGCDVHLATADGSAGVRGFVTTAIAECRPEFDYFYACGPLPMLRALCDAVPQDGQLSFEERMGCGFGACMGCSCKTKYGNKRICKEGPVLTKGEVIW